MFHKIKYKLLLWIFLLTIFISVSGTVILLHFSKIHSIQNSTLLISNILEQVKKNINFKIKSSNDITLRLYSNSVVLEAFGRDDNIPLDVHYLDSSKLYGLFSEITRSNSDQFIQLIDFNRDVEGASSKINRFSSNRFTALIEEEKLLSDPLYNELLNDTEVKYKMGFLQKETWVYSNNYIFFIRMINRGIINNERITENYTETINTTENIGVIIYGVTVNSFLRIYKDSILVDTGEVYIVNDKGLLLSTSDNTIGMDNKNGPIDVGYFKQGSDLLVSGSKWIDIENKKYLLNFHRDQELGFYIYTLQLEDSILENFMFLKKLTITSSVIRLIIIILVAVFFIGYFTKPIEILTFYMVKFIKNKTDKNIEDKIIKDLKTSITSSTEIGTLSRTFETLLTTQKALHLEILKREKIKAETQQRSKDHLSTILNSLPSMIVSVDDNYRISQWNSLAEEMCQKSTITVIGRVVWDELPILKRFYNDINSIIGYSTKDTHFEAKNISWNNKFINISVSQLSSHISRGAIIRIDDVTEKVRIGELLIQSEKMLSVGGLAAGMAHEINNPLGGMMQNASVLHNRLVKNIDLPVNIKAAEEAGTDIKSIKKYMESRSISKFLENIQESGLLIRSIINNMLSFSRKGGDITSSYHLEPILDKSIEFASADIDDDIEIIKQIEDDLPAIQCDPVKIQQVILNILINGSHAMHFDKTEKPLFNIVIKLGDDGKNIIVEIQDNGPGMSEEVSKRIFEPFYTTKPVGLGTGLGLSISYFIITENHRGTLSVISSPGLGAKFIISLPIIQEKY